MRLVLNTAIATMALTPAISGATPWIYERLARQRAREPLQTLNIPDAGLADHVVVAGGGRVGRTVADALAELRLPCVVIELDDRRVQDARGAGLPVIYGDASQAVVLDAAHLLRARVLVVTVPTYSDVRAIVNTARRLRRETPIIARADGPDAVRDLYALGIDEVTAPEVEGAIAMTRAALVHLGARADDYADVANMIRRQRYGSAPTARS